MAYLSKIISENLELAMKRAKEDARPRGEKMSWSELAKRMSERMERERQEFREVAAGAGEAVPNEIERERYDRDTIERVLRDYRSGRRPWRVDYLEAAIACLGSHPARIVSENYDAAKVPEATVATFLTGALGRRLTPKQARALVSDLNRQLDRPGMFDLVHAIVEAILDAKSKPEAVGAVLLQLERSDAWSDESEGGASTSATGAKTGKIIRKK